MEIALIIIHVVIAVILIVTVLMQHGKQQGLSGAIAGGAETFFGKNKGRTIDGILQKLTSVVAVLFVISSIVLVVYTTRDTTVEVPEGTEVTEQADANADTAADAADATADADADANSEEKAE